MALKTTSFCKPCYITYKISIQKLGGKIAANILMAFLLQFNDADNSITIHNHNLQKLR